MRPPFIDPEVPLKLFDPDESESVARHCLARCDAPLRNEAAAPKPELAAGRRVFGND